TTLNQMIKLSALTALLKICCTCARLSVRSRGVCFYHTSFLLTIRRSKRALAFLLILSTTSAIRVSLPLDGSRFRVGGPPAIADSDSPVSASTRGVKPFLHQRAAVIRQVRDNLARAQKRQDRQSNRLGRSNLASFSPNHQVLLLKSVLSLSALIDRANGGHLIPSSVQLG
ncbi:hypothetical protein AeNC1_011790, partial [Aphanomyces euteiches]